jgi:hypothetical protein
LVLSLLAAGAAVAAASDERPTPDAAAVTECKPRSYLFARAETRRGSLWTYLGAFDDADAAGKATLAARNGFGESFDKYAVTKGRRLQLPAADDPRTVFVLERLKPYGELVGRYKSADEAATAAAELQRRGERFMILYDQFAH